MVETRSERRGDNLVKPGSNKEVWMGRGIKTDSPKGNDSRVPVEIWYIGHTKERGRERGSI